MQAPLDNTVGSGATCISKAVALPSQASSTPQQLSANLDSFGIFSLAGFYTPSAPLEDLSCYPNPFNPSQQSVTVQYYLSKDADISVAIFDLFGGLVKKWDVASGDYCAKAGINQMPWDGRNGRGDVVANGGYIVSISGDGRMKRFKVLVLK
jgi:hypothetical protein